MAAPQAIPFTFQNAVSAAANGSVLEFSNLDPATLAIIVAVSGTMTGLTLNFEWSADNTNWNALPVVPLAAGALPGTSITSVTPPVAALYYSGPSVDVGLNWVRVRTSGSSTGTATVTGTARRRV